MKDKEIKRGESVVFTSRGKVLRFNSAEVCSRQVSPLKCIKTVKGEITIGLFEDINDSSEFLVVTSDGYIKKIQLKEVKRKKMGAIGNDFIKLNSPRALVVGVTRAKVGGVVELELSNKSAVFLEHTLFPALELSSPGVLAVKLEDKLRIRNAY